MEIFILATQDNGTKKLVAAFTKEESLLTYAEAKGIEEPTIEPMTVTQEALGKTERVYVAYYSPSEEGGAGLFVGYHLNKFNALMAVHNKGYLDAIMIDPSEEEEEESDEVVETTTESGSGKKVKKKKKKDAGPAYASTPGGNIRLLVGLVVVWVAIIGALSFFSTEVEFAEDVASVTWLPASCTNVSYYISGNMRVFEFSTNPAGYREFAKQEQLKLRDADEPFKVRTYRRYADVSMEAIESLPEDEQWEKWEEISYPEIEIGLKVIGHLANEELKVEGGFDVKTNRGYFWSRNY